MPVPRKALITDYDPDFREMVETWLTDAGWEVSQARNWRRMLQKLDGTIDVVTLDRRMPLPSGSEVVERLGETPFEGRVIVMSANLPDEHLSEADVDEYLVKPIRRDQLVSLLASVSNEPAPSEELPDSSPE